MNREETSTIVKKIHDLYIHQDRYITSASISARINYWDIYFKDFSFAVVNKVIDTWAKSHRDMPTPSDLLPLCKDERQLEWAREQNINDDVKATHVLIWEARNGALEKAEIPKEVRTMTDRMVESLRRDPKIRAEYEARHPEQFADDALPYEI